MVGTCSFGGIVVGTHRGDEIHTNNNIEHHWDASRSEKHYDKPSRTILDFCHFFQRILAKMAGRILNLGGINFGFQASRKSLLVGGCKGIGRRGEEAEKGKKLDRGCHF